MGLKSLLSRRRFVVLRKTKNVDRRDIVEFLEKGQALSFAAKCQKAGMKPRIYEVRLTWPEWLQRIAEHYRSL